MQLYFSFIIRNFVQFIPFEFKLTCDINASLLIVQTILDLKIFITKYEMIKLSCRDIFIFWNNEITNIFVNDTMVHFAETF